MFRLKSWPHLFTNKFMTCNRRMIHKSGWRILATNNIRRKCQNDLRWTYQWNIGFIDWYSSNDPFKWTVIARRACFDVGPHWQSQNKVLRAEIEEVIKNWNIVLTNYGMFSIAFSLEVSVQSNVIKSLWSWFYVWYCFWSNFNC